MGTPDERKTMQVSPDVHAAVHELATQLGTSADGALRHLLDKCTVRVQLPPRQHERWTKAADATGLQLGQWVSHCVEAAMEYGGQRKTIEQIFYRVDALSKAAGLGRPQRRPLKGN